MLAAGGASPRGGSPRQTMVVAPGTQRTSAPSRKGSSVEKRRAGIPGPRPAGQAAGQGRAEVAKGEVIAQLRQDEFQARLQALQGQLDQARAALTALRAGERPEERLRREAQVRAAEARLANARAEFDRYAAADPVEGRLARRVRPCRNRLPRRPGRAQGGPADRSRRDRSPARRTSRPRRPQVRGLEGRVVEANLQLEDSTLRAPYDGVIAQRFVEEGQNVQAKEPVVRFQDVDEIEIVVDVPETVMAADIRPADIVQDGRGVQRRARAAVPGAASARSPRWPTRRRRRSRSASPCRPRPASNVLPGMTATVDRHLPPRQHPGQPRSSCRSRPSSRTARASRWRGSSAPDQNRLAPPGEARRGDGRPDRDRRRAAAGRPHRRRRRDVPARRHEGPRSGRRARRRPVMNPGELSVRNNRVVFVAMLLVLVGGFVAYQQHRPARGSRVHDQGSADHHALPRGQRRGGRQGGHQPDRERLPAARPARPRRVGVVARQVGRHRAIIKDRYHKDAHPAGVGRAAPQDRRRPAAAAALGARHGRW